jgi:hypothetical protein
MKTEECPAIINKGVCFASNNDISCAECIKKYKEQQKEKKK